MITTTEEYKQKLEESSGELKEINSDIESLNSELETTKTRIKELSSKNSLSIVEQKELDSLKETNAELEKQIVLREKEQKLKSAEVSQDFADTVYSWQNNHADGTDNNWWTNFWRYGGFGGYNPGQAIADTNEGNQQQALEKKIEEYKQAQSESDKAEIEEDIVNKLSELRDFKQQLSDVPYENLSDDAKKAYDYISDVENRALLVLDTAKNIQTVFDSVYYSDKYSTARDSLSKLGDEGKLTAEKVKELYNSNDNVKEMLQYLSDLGLIDLSNLNSACEQLANQLNVVENEAQNVSTLDFTIDTETLTKQLEEQQDEISKIADNYKKISGVIDDYNASGSLSIENLEALISVGDEYISTLFDENGKLNLNKDSYVKLAKAKLEDIRYSMLENAISSLNQLSKDDETSANNELSESTGKLTEETLKLVAAKKLAEGVSGDKIQNIIHIYSEWSALIDNTEAGLENNIDATLGLSNASDTLKDSLESEKKALENSKSALEDKKKTLEDTKDNYENAIDSIKSLIDWTEKYIKQTKDDEIKSLEDKKKSVDDLIESQKELLQAQKDEYDWNKEISDKQNSVAKNALAASIASLDDSSAGKKTYKEAIDTLSESRSDMADSLYEHSIDTRMDALDKLKEQSDEYYDSEIDKINEFLDDEVALYKAACSMIDNDNGTLYSNLLNYCKTYTTTSEAEFNHMWTSAQSAMQQYNIANLDTFSLLNDLQGRIYEVDTAIDTVADNIQSYEDRISGVQSKLDNLSNSAQTAINNINAAIEASNNLGDNNGNSNNTSFWVNYNGKKYQTGYNYSGDTNSNRLLAANELTKLIAKDVSGFDQYGLGIVQGLLGVGNEKTKSNNKFDNSALINGVSKDFNGNNIQPKDSNSSNISSTNKSPYKLKFPHYAKGTRNAKGGVSQVNENGLETLMKQTPQGDFVVLNQGDQVFTKEQTDNLQEISRKPAKYIYDNVDLDALAKKGYTPLTDEEISNLGLWANYSDVLANLNSKIEIPDLSKKVLENISKNSELGDNINQNIRQNINYYNTNNIHGDVNPQMLRLLEKKEKEIIDKSAKNIMSIALKHKNIIK